jgi:hypothetical protein
MGIQDYFKPVDTWLSLPDEVRQFLKDRSPKEYKLLM